ncbi:MAG: sulfite exporter TauE/SafE family protein [Pseudomonadota bacterium]
MDALFPLLSPVSFFLACFIALCAGFVKGVVGFAMPLVFVSGLTLFMSPELALAGLILPTLVTNLFQSLRQGVAAAWGSVQSFWIFLVTGGVMLFVTAQFVRQLPKYVLELAIGLPVVTFVTLQLLGVRLTLPSRTAVTEVLAGLVGGFMGGIAAIWGPPTVMYLTAVNTSKRDQMRIQGVIYSAGAVVLLIAHLGSGVLRAETIPFSLALILPALAGMYAGTRIADRIDQQMFRRATLLVLFIAGLNLVRRGLM